MIQPLPLKHGDVALNKSEMVPYLMEFTIQRHVEQLQE